MGAAREQLTCSECRTIFEAKGRTPRCPSCGEVWHEYIPLPPLPYINVPDYRLEDPAFPRRAPTEPAAAPLSEFVAAFGVLGGFLTMIAGAVLTTPVILLAGAAILAVAAVVYFVGKLRSVLRRTHDLPPGEMPNPWRRFPW